MGGMGLREEASADADSVSFHFQRSRSFRSLREKTYREKPHALFARARLVEIDLNVIDPQPPAIKSLFRPKSIEFVSFQNKSEMAKGRKVSSQWRESCCTPAVDCAAAGLNQHGAHTCSPL